MRFYHKNQFGLVNNYRSFSKFIALSILFVIITAIIVIPAAGENSDGTVPVINGIISANEYDHKAEFAGGDFKIYWTVGESNISIGLSAKTNGWVAFGIGNSMTDADMIIGWVNSTGGATVLDCYSESSRDHPVDEDLGGTDDIESSGGSESDGWTHIEFTRDLSTGDTYDAPIKKSGELEVIWAYGSSDNFNAQHSEFGSGTINLVTGEVEEDEEVRWQLHAFLMIIGLILIGSGNAIAGAMKKKTWWFSAHKTLEGFGGVFAFIGFGYAFYMISVSTNEHFSEPHTFLGLITVIFIVITLRLGKTITKPAGSSKKFKALHRWFGRITTIMMLITVYAGYSLV
ncbi:MAG: hypothetical protein JSV49_00795 [Thermoplasmata archaeon]|nr:MAG: hypothetical protein JSV49_00795 [Thermoplasmata archaeon]